MIVLYSTNCPKCKVIESKLKQAGLNFSIVDDFDQVVEVGNAHGIQSAPFIDVDGDFYDFSGIIKYLKERENK